jgi:hypothetical protein
MKRFSIKSLPVGKAIINFHDPILCFFVEVVLMCLQRSIYMIFKSMYENLFKMPRCMTPSHLLSKDLQLIYGNQKSFTLPINMGRCFNLSDRTQVRKK